MRRKTLAILLMFGLHVAAAGAQELCGNWMAVEPTSAPPVLIYEITALSPTDIWAIEGTNGAIRFDGLSWTSVPLPDLSGLGTGFRLDALGSVGGTLVACGVLTTSVWTNEQLLLVWDGGDWSRVETLELAENDFSQPRYGAPRAIDGVSPDDLWIVGTASSNPPGGMGGVVLTVRWNGSALVEYITPGRGDRQNHLYDVAAIATDDAWAVGEFTSIQLPENGAMHGMTYHWDGSSWSHVPNPTETMDSVHLHEIVAIASDDVWAAGQDPNGPLFLHWDGSSWAIVPSPPMNGGIHQLAAVASDDIWAVRNPGQVPLISSYLHWDGSAWNTVASPDQPGASSVNRAAGLTVAGPCDVWAVGNIDFGSGVVPYAERLLASATAAPERGTATVQLAQNEPNPFNPSTTIPFRLSQPGHVELAVYDLAGRHVLDLLSEFREAGWHAIPWNGRDAQDAPVASGVYVYRLEAAGQIETRRMVLLR